MSIGNSISIGTHGRYTMPSIANIGSDLPGTKTQLTLQEITASFDTSGTPTLSAPITVQSLLGVLLPLSTTEKEEFYSKVGVRASYKYLVSPSQFTSTLNASKLVEKNILVSDTERFEIVGKENYTHAQRGAHYKVMLEVLS